MAASRHISILALVCALLAWTQLAHASNDSELERARVLVRDGQARAAIPVLQKLANQRTFAHQDEALELLGVAHEKSGQLALAKLAYKQFLQRFPKSPEAPVVQQRLRSLVTATLPGKKSTASKKRVAASDRIVNTYFSEYLRYDQRRIDVFRPGLEPTSVGSEITRLDTDLDVSVRQSLSFTRALLRASMGHSYRVGDLGYGETRLRNLYVDAEGTGFAWRARVGRFTRHRGGFYGRMDGAVLSYSPVPRIDLEVVTGRRVTSDSADTAPVFSGVSASVDFGERIETEAHILQESNALGTLSSIVGMEARFMDSRTSALGQLDYDLAFQRLDNARLHLQRRGPGNASYYGTAEAHRMSFLDLERLALEDPLFDPTLLDPDEIYFYATRDAQLSKTLSMGVRGDAMARSHYDISATSAQYPGTAGNAWTHTMTFQLATDGFLGPSGSAGTMLTVANEAEENRAAFQVYVIRNFGNFHVRPRLRLDYIKNGGTAAFDRYIVTPLLRLDYRGRHARYELQAGASYGDTESPDRQSTEIGLFISLGYRLTF